MEHEILKWEKERNYYFFLLWNYWHGLFYSKFGTPILITESQDAQFISILQLSASYPLFLTFVLSIVSRAHALYLRSRAYGQSYRQV